MLILLMALTITLPLRAKDSNEERLALSEISNPILENEILRKRNEILINLLIETEAREKRRDLTVARLEAKITLDEETITMQQALLGLHSSKGAFGMTSKKKAIEVYKKLYEKTPNIKFKNKIEELEKLI